MALPVRLCLAARCRDETITFCLVYYVRRTPQRLYGGSSCGADVFVFAKQDRIRYILIILSRVVILEIMCRGHSYATAGGRRQISCGTFSGPEFQDLGVEGSLNSEFRVLVRPHPLIPSFALGSWPDLFESFREMAR